MLDCFDEVFHVGAEIWKPGEYPEMRGVAGPSRIPVIYCPTEFGDNDLFQEEIVYKTR
jgi:hypothetical protein